MLQFEYSAPELCVRIEQEEFGDAAQQKETMKQLVKGWNNGIYQQLLEATPPDQIKFSKIYQRCVLQLFHTMHMD